MKYFIFLPFAETQSVHFPIVGRENDLFRRLQKTINQKKWKFGHVEPVAQRQDMVSGTLALLNGFSGAAVYVSRASAPKGDEVL